MQVLGKVVAHMYTIEFQKRGLPHAHILLILDRADKPTTADDYDRLVCAELPDPDGNETEKLLHARVLRFMVHGPCGASNAHSPCMEDGCCTKRFPKALRETTSADREGYPEYRRRARATPVQYRSKGRTIPIDNRWVVPYNRALLLKYNCHINVEVCSTVTAVKYIHKYIYKVKLLLRTLSPACVHREQQQQRASCSSIVRQSHCSATHAHPHTA